MAGADFEPDKDPPRFASKRERYTPRTERIVVVLTATSDALITKEPRMSRLVVRPITNGKPGAIVGAKQILLGVAPGRVSMLHVLTEPVELTVPPAAPGTGGGSPEKPNFKSLLLKSLGK